MKTSAKVFTIIGVASCLISLIILIFYVFNIDAFVNIINQEVSLTQPEQDNLKLIYSVIFTIAIIEFIGLNYNFDSDFSKQKSNVYQQQY